MQLRVQSLEGGLRVYFKKALPKWGHYWSHSPPLIDQCLRSASSLILMRGLWRDPNSPSTETEGLQLCISFAYALPSALCWSPGWVSVALPFSALPT